MLKLTFIENIIDVSELADVLREERQNTAIEILKDLRVDFVTHEQFIGDYKMNKIAERYNINIKQI